MGCSKAFLTGKLPTGSLITPICLKETASMNESHSKSIAGNNAQTTSIDYVTRMLIKRKQSHQLTMLSIPASNTLR